MIRSTDAEWQVKICDSRVTLYIYCSYIKYALNKRRKSRNLALNYKRSILFSDLPVLQCAVFHGKLLPVKEKLRFRRFYIGWAIKSAIFWSKSLFAAFSVSWLTDKFIPKESTKTRRLLTGMERVCDKILQDPWSSAAITILPCFEDSPGAILDNIPLRGPGFDWITTESEKLCLKNDGGKSRLIITIAINICPHFCLKIDLDIRSQLLEAHVHPLAQCLLQSFKCFSINRSF